MSKLAVLDDLLVRYHQLKYHHNPTLKQKLNDVQDWQRKRLCQSHHAFFTQKNHQLMADYFVNRLYGGKEFDEIAVQIERLVKHAHKVEKLIPETAIKTGTHGIELAILAVELDEHVAEKLLETYPGDTPLNNEMMRLTYLAVGQKDDRLKQLKMADEFGYNLDHYLRSFIVQTAFKMAKPVAYKHRFNVMYDFMHDGFVAMKPLKSAQKFVETFTQKERQVVLNVHSGDLNPFACV